MPLSLPKPVRRISRSRWSGMGYFIPAFIVLTAVLLGLVRAENDERERYLSAQRLAAAEELAKVSSSLESNIHGNLNLIYGLVAAVSANTNITGSQFSALGERIFGVPSQLRSITASPDLVVKYVYPESFGDTIIGLDYHTAPQGESVRQAVARRTLVISGPVKLEDGSKSLIARYPVFSLANGRFWGVISALVDLDRLFSDSGVDDEHQPLDISIAERPQPGAGDLFKGNPAVFNDDPVKAIIEIGFDNWYLAAVPKGGWRTTPPDIALFRTYAFLIAFAIVAPLVWAGVLMRQRQSSIVTLEQREEELQATHYRLALALDASSIGVWEYEVSTGRLFWDARLQQMYGMTSASNVFTLSNWRDRVHGDDVIETERMLIAALNEEKPFITQFRIVSGNGDVRHIRAHGVTYRTASGLLRIVGANWDVTEDIDLQDELLAARLRTEAQNDELRATRRTLEHLSLHDALTGLPNRRYLDQFMDAATASSAEHRLAFIHFDLDRFKEVNDTLGHAAGDELLRLATTRVLSLVGSDEFASRIGGDEFVVVTSGPAAGERAGHLAQSIVGILGKPFRLDGNDCLVGCSAGIAVQTDKFESARQLLVNADVALYEAKKRGRNRMEVFSDDLLLTAIQVKRVSDDLLRALDNDEIVPFFQPQFNAQTLEITGVEALARWNHPTRGLLTPDKFLDVAESLHRAADIDGIILEKSLFQMARWRALGVGVPHLSVNVSAQRLREEGLMTRLSNLVFQPGTLSFELLESISFDGMDDAMRAVIERIRQCGIGIEIDDFGSGHASIVGLLELGPNRLKIDRRLIAPLEASGSQRRLIASIIEIGQSQGIEIVAEGVETPEHAEILRSLGCQVLQGYAFAKPMSTNDFIAFAGDWQERQRSAWGLAEAGRRRLNKG